MMKPFNLAEIKISERNRCRREVNRRLRMAAALIILCFVVAVGSFACKVSISARASRLRSELADVQARCVRAKQDMAALKLRSGQRDWQKQLTDGSKQWLDVLSAITGRLPADCWISRIENSPQNTAVTLEGGASSYESVSAYMSRLRRAPGMTDVRLSNSRVTASNRGTFVEFALQIKLKAALSQPGTAQPAAANVPEVPRST
jgi:Tfp pilus assembly protein PilN